MNFTEGDVVFPTSTLSIATIAANKQIYAYITLSEKLLVNLFEEYDCSTSDELLKKLPPVSLYTTWGEELPQKGHFDAVSGEADVLTGSVLLRASFDNPSEMFRNGSNGYVGLPTTRHGVFVIPQEATIHIQDKCFVYRIVDGKAVSTEVKGLSANDEHYVVTSGLNDGDVIIAENAGMVTDGMAVVQETGKK
jgi:membrane fusion protein (multidrug efflux system)